MRPAILLCLFVVFGGTANAQFTLLPQVGFENSRTSIGYNDLPSFTPAGTVFSPQVGIRLDYKNKQGFGPFLGIATSRSIVAYNFSDPQTGMNTYTTSRGNTQVRLEGGFQVSTNPIYFGKAGSSNSNYQKNGVKKSCGSSMARTSCGNKANKAAPAAKSNEKGTWMRIQPSLGMAYIPFSPTGEIQTKSQAAQTSYAYNAGNWKTAVISGVGFEFGKNAQRTFLVSLNYLRGIGNLDTRSITSISGNKPTTTNLQSGASTWNLRMGIPVSLSKTKQVTRQPVIEKKEQKIHYYKEEKRCGQYRIQYKPQCRKVI